MKKLAILASGSGTNAENIYRFFSRGSKIAVDVVIYDRKDAGVAARMQPYGVDAIYIPGSVWRERPEEIRRRWPASCGWCPTAFAKHIGGDFSISIRRFFRPMAERGCMDIMCIEQSSKPARRSRA